MQKKSINKSKLVITTAIAGVSLLTYGRRAYGAYSGCHHTAGTSYLCDSAAVAPQDFINKNNAIVTTAAGFSINTAAGNAIVITGDGALSLTDTHASTISTTDNTSLFIRADTGGSITVNANSNFLGHNAGFVAWNYGTGVNNVTLSGSVITTNSDALYNYNGSSATDLILVTGDNSNITGSARGILFVNEGTGVTTLTANGTVTGQSSTAIQVENAAGSTSLNITTGTNSYIHGTGAEAINLFNQSNTGNTNITINGDVTGTGAAAVYNRNTHTNTNFKIYGGTGGTLIQSTTTAAITSQAATAVNLTLDGSATSVRVTGVGGTAINFGTANDTLTIAKTVNINGSVTGGAGGTDTLNIGTSKITMGTGSVFSGFEAANVTGAMTLQAGKTITIGSTTPIAIGTGGTLQVVVGSSSNFGQLESASGVTFSGTGAITVDATGIGTIADKTTLSNVFSGGTVTGLTAGLLTDNSDAYQFTSVVNANSIDILVETVAVEEEAPPPTIASSASSDNSTAAANALDQINDANSGDSALRNVIATITGYSTDAEKDAALKTLLPDTSGSSSNATIAVIDAALGSVEGHMQTASMERNNTTIATGGPAQNNAVWGQVFGTNIKQGFRDGIDGYEADSAGFTVGLDGCIDDEVRLGAAFSHAATKAKGISNRAEISSSQATFYSVFSRGKLYLEGLLSGAINNIANKRTLFDNSVATADYNSYQVSSKATAGYRANIGLWNVTPFTSLQYGVNMQPDYTETGSSADLTVLSNNIEMLKSGLGVKIERPIQWNSYTYIPHMSTTWYYDFMNDAAIFDASFASSPSVLFSSRGATPGRSAFKLGIGLDLLSADTITISADYNLEARETFRAHMGEVKFRIAF